MSPGGEEAKLTILLGTAIILLFGIAVVALLAIFQKKSQLNQKEKQILKDTYEKTILQAQLEIQEHTFNIISGELHDNVGQILSLAKVQINIMTESNDLNKTMLDNVKENVGKAMNDLRDMAKGLNSERIRLASLHRVVQEELNRINNTGVLIASLCCDGTEKPLDADKKLILFRIIQECINNCIKHAMATKIQVSFRYMEELLQVNIIDNGKGFELSGIAAANTTGLGLLNIKKRAQLAGGEAIIESALNEGTNILINIPYE
jgi:two-component system, NarL family, sensor kinase